LRGQIKNISPQSISDFLEELLTVVINPDDEEVDDTDNITDDEAIYENSEVVECMVTLLLECMVDGFGIDVPSDESSGSDSTSSSQTLVDVARSILIEIMSSQSDYFRTALTDFLSSNFSSIATSVESHRNTFAVVAGCTAVECTDLAESINITSLLPILGTLLTSDESETIRISSARAIAMICDELQSQLISIDIDQQLLRALLTSIDSSGEVPKESINALICVCDAIALNNMEQGDEGGHVPHNVLSDVIAELFETLFKIAVKCEDLSTAADMSADIQDTLRNITISGSSRATRSSTARTARSSRLSDDRSRSSRDDDISLYAMECVRKLVDACADDSIHLLQTVHATVLARITEFLTSVNGLLTTGNVGDGFQLRRLWRAVGPYLDTDNIFEKSEARIQPAANTQTLLILGHAITLANSTLAALSSNAELSDAVIIATDNAMLSVAQLATLPHAISLAPYLDGCLTQTITFLNKVLEMRASGERDLSCDDGILVPIRLIGDVADNAKEAFGPYLETCIIVLVNFFKDEAMPM
jgi:hypothetical protein